MKKIFSLLLVLTMVFSLCACGGNKTVDLTGTYKTRMWFLDGTIVLNENTTCEIPGDKGTFVTEGDKLTFTSKDNSYQKEEFAIETGYIYDTNDSWYFDKDEEYGLAFSPNDNGFTDQSFEACVINDEVGGSPYSWLYLDLNADGTYILKVGIREMTSLDVLETYEGTYTSDDSTLTLTYNGQEYTMLVNDNSQIIFLIYDKV